MVNISGTDDFTNKVDPFKCNDWPDNIVDVKCGFFFTLVLTSSGEVYSCGSNTNLQLGREAPDDRSASLERIELYEIIRIECGNFHSMCIDIYGNFYVFGRIFMAIRIRKEYKSTHYKTSYIIECC